jgi:hypothetical protein
MKPAESESSIEIEVKYLGAEEECERILGWLEAQEFEIERKEPIHRIHVYFDDEDRLRTVGCRLRCVIAPGEWCRYDFKADGWPQFGKTLEVSQKKALPLALPEVIDELLVNVPDDVLREQLSQVRNTAKARITLLGLHSKVIVSNGNLKLEVTLDRLTSIESGLTCSEIEVELIDGEHALFEQFMSVMSSQLDLTRIHGTKLDRFVGPLL